MHCMKTLLRKTIGSHILTFREHNTVLNQIEQVLNSRPLVPIDSSAEDGSTLLTPWLFLIGRSLHGLPHRGYTEKTSSLLWWNLVQCLSEDFWRRWEGISEMPANEVQVEDWKPRASCG